MSKLRSVSTAFWSDPFIEDLSPSEKLLFLYFITNEKTNMLGIYEVSIKKISFDTGLDKTTISKALESFETLSKVKYINNHIVLVNFMKHQNFNTNMKKSAIDVYNNLPIELKNNNIKVSKDDPSKGFETLLNHYGMVRKVEVEYEYETEDETEDETEGEGEKQIFSDDDVELDRNIKLAFLEVEKNKEKNVAPKKESNISISESLKYESPEWLDNVAMQQRHLPVIIIQKIDEFLIFLKTQEKEHTSRKEFVSHFINWISKKAQINQNKDPAKKENFIAGRQTEETLTSNFQKFKNYAK